MGTISDVMSRSVTTIRLDDTVEAAAQRMRDEGIGDVIVLDDADQVCGILTDRDITVRAVAEGRSPRDTRIADVCSGDLVTLSPDDSTERAVQLMRERTLRRLPVVDNGKAVGIVSIGDLAIEKDPESALADISAAESNT